MAARHLLVIAAAFLAGCTAEVPLSDMFPFGATAGDTLAPKALDEFVTVNLANGATLNFFNHTYSTFYINNNGGVSFTQGVTQFTPTCAPSNIPMIMPYWADFDTRYEGQLFYRQTTDATLVAKATAETQTAYPGLVNLQISWLFIITWFECPCFRPGCTNESQKNTVQLVIATDSDGRSYATFNYNQIQWTTSVANGGSGGDCNGVGGQPAKAGFDAGDGQTIYTIDGSCTGSIMNVTSTTNVGYPGKYIFRMDEGLEDPAPEPVTEPATTAEPTTNATTTTTMEPSTNGTSTTTTMEPSTNATTEAATEPTTNGTTTTVETPAGECTPDMCLHTGHCFSYSLCDATRGVWETHNCSLGLFWNPHHTGNTTLTECYGSCDVWDNLTPETQAMYKADETCFPQRCYYEAVEECGSEYLYHSKELTERNEVARLTCPQDTREGMNVSLVWVQDRESCDFCYNVLNNSTGQPCCAVYDAHIPGPSTTTTASPSTSSTTTAGTTTTTSPTNSTSTTTTTVSPSNSTSIGTTTTSPTTTNSTSTTTWSPIVPVPSTTEDPSTSTVAGPPASTIVIPGASVPAQG